MKSRVISCAELHSHHVALPRDCPDEAREVLAEQGVQLDMSDERQLGDALNAKFTGTLFDDVLRALEAGRHPC
jgi:hypothetical protein